jgi:hypothetical protein
LKPTLPEYEVEVYPFLRVVYSKFYDHTNVTAGQSVTKRRRIAHIPGSSDKSLARPTSRCILFGGENISFDASLVIYTNSTNIPPIMIINKIYETQNLLSL